MRHKFETAIATVISLGIGNFIWQAHYAVPNFLEASERTFFQSIAILAYMLFQWIYSNE